MSDYAVIGQPIEHSLSPFLHQHFAKQFGLVFDYDKILVDPSSFSHQVETFFQAGGKGLNVTSPYKQQAFTLSDVATARCIKAKAANMLWQQDGKLMADTTDGLGLMRDLSRYLNISGRSILILGAGGAVRSILEPLLEASPATITLANRTQSRALELQGEFNRDGLIEVTTPDQLNQTYDVIIHATAQRETHCDGLPDIILQKSALVYDLNYTRQGLTAFVKHARALGCRAVDGLGMLVFQAAESFKIWHGMMPDVSDYLI